MGCATQEPPAAAPVDAARAAPVPTSLTAYLPKGSLDGKVVLGPPPAADSPHGRADRAFYDDTRSLKDTPRWREAIQDNDLWGGGAIKRFSCVLGVDINERQTPVTWKLMHRLELDVRNIGGPAKDHFA